MKYIDADKLLAVLERQNADKNIINPLIRIIDSLQQEQPDFADASKMEQPSVEDAMKALNEKIALVKENGTWDGVDVDKYMDDVRGREPEIDFEKEVDKTVNECTNGYDFDWEGFARHFFELGLKARKEE